MGRQNVGLLVFLTSMCIFLKTVKNGGGEGEQELETTYELKRAGWSDGLGHVEANFSSFR